MNNFETTNHTARLPPGPEDWPVWFNGKKINEVLFCEEFLRKRPMICVHDAFFTTEGRVTDETMLKKEILDRIKPYVTSGVAKRAANLLDALRMECWSPPLPVYQDRIHVANGTLFLNGTFSEAKDFCINRLPVRYAPDAPPPVKWLAFLTDLLEPDDILTLQEFMGYCLIPSTKGQKMLIITGRGGEGKSRLGLVFRALLGQNMNTGSIAKVEISPFARADLEHELLMVDDDMKLEALPQTNHIKAIVTAELPMDLKKKQTQENMKAAVADGNNIVEFMQSTGYISFEADTSASSRDLYAAYKLWCEDNAYNALSMKSFCNYLNQSAGSYGISHTNNIYIGGGRRSRGFTGLRVLVRQY